MSFPGGNHGQQLCGLLPVNEHTNTTAILWYPVGGLADQHFERALAICEKQFGKGHANTAKVLIGFAESQQKRGNHAKAKLLAERALAIQEKALPLGHLDLADTLETLAEIHTGLGNTKEANRYASRAKAIREKLSSSK